MGNLVWTDGFTGGSGRDFGLLRTGVPQNDECRFRQPFRALSVHYVREGKGSLRSCPSEA